MTEDTLSIVVSGVRYYLSEHDVLPAELTLDWIAWVFADGEPPYLADIHPHAA